MKSPANDNCTLRNETSAVEHPASEHSAVAEPAPTSGGEFWPAAWHARVVFLPAALAILLVRCYQKILSPVIGRTCRFHPSCSQYYILAVRKYGLLPGSWRGVCRISRCHPWNPGGDDPP